MVASLSLKLWPEITKNIIEMSMLVPAGVEAKTPVKAWQEGVEDCISKVRSWPHASQIVWAFLDIGAWILPPLLLKHGFFITDMIDCSHKGRFIIGQGFKCWKFIWRCLLLFPFLEPVSEITTNLKNSNKPFLPNQWFRMKNNSADLKPPIKNLNCVRNIRKNLFLEHLGITRWLMRRTPFV